MDMEPGCRCEHGFFRDENGDCVPMEDCGCITRPNGEVKDVSRLLFGYIDRFYFLVIL